MGLVLLLVDLSRVVDLWGLGRIKMCIAGSGKMEWSCEYIYIASEGSKRMKCLVRLVLCK